MSLAGIEFILFRVAVYCYENSVDNVVFLVDWCLHRDKAGGEQEICREHRRES